MNADLNITDILGDCQSDLCYAFELIFWLSANICGCPSCPAYTSITDLE